MLYPTLDPRPRHFLLAIDAPTLHNGPLLRLRVADEVDATGCGHTPRAQFHGDQGRAEHMRPQLQHGTAREFSDTGLLMERGPGGPPLQIASREADIAGG